MRNLIFALMFSLLSLFCSSESFAQVPAENSDQALPNSSPVLNRTREHLYAGTAEEGEQELSKIKITEDNRGDLAFGLGLLRLVVAFEHLGQKLRSYGFLTTPEGSNTLFGTPMPSLFSRSRDEPPPEVLTYEKWRAILDATIADLDRVEQTFALIGDKPVAFRIDPLKVRVNINGKAQGISSETLWQLTQRMSLEHQADSKKEKKVLVADIDFDGADALWIRGYTNLVNANLQLLLAHDHSASFPYIRSIYFKMGEPKQTGPVFRETTDGQLALMVSFIHTIRWPVVEPERLVDAHTRLKKMIRLSRESWKIIGQRTPGDATRWIPGPGEKSVLGIPVTKEIINAWHDMLDESEAVLDGRKLIPGASWWGLPDKYGFNVRRMFMELKTFDLVLLFAGYDVRSFVEEGEVISEEKWAKTLRPFQGNIFTYALWFN